MSGAVLYPDEMTSKWENEGTFPLAVCEVLTELLSSIPKYISEITSYDFKLVSRLMAPCRPALLNALPS